MQRNVAIPMSGSRGTAKSLEGMWSIYVFVSLYSRTCSPPYCCGVPGSAPDTLFEKQERNSKSKDPKKKRNLKKCEIRNLKYWSFQVCRAQKNN